MTGPVGAVLTRRHQVAQINNAALSAVTITELGRDLKAGTIGRDEFITAVVGADLFFYNVAVGLATQYMTAYRAAEAPNAGHANLAIPKFDAGASYGRAVGTLWDLDTATRAGGDRVGRDFDAEYWRIVEDLAVRSDRGSLNAGRAVVADSAHANGVGWRRVSDGNPCAFCAMLVGRGPVYTSRQTAGIEVKFHKNCGCTVEEAFDWTPTAEEARYAKAYTDARAEAGPNDWNSVASRMRENGDFNDSPSRRAPKTQTGNAGGGGGRPPRRVRGMLADTPDEFPEFNGWRPTARRSEIEEFDLIDAEILLNGDGSTHGGHRYGRGAGKSEFPQGWGEQDVVDWVNAIIDSPSDGKPLDKGGFVLFGSYQDVDGVTFIRRHGRWMIATGYPVPMRRWPHVSLD